MKLDQFLKFMGIVQTGGEAKMIIKSGKISVNSPIGKGLLGTSVGDIAEVNVPNGVLKFEILSINR